MQVMEIQQINPGERDYPSIAIKRIADAAPGDPYALGDVDILHNPLLGLICSVPCPGSIIIKTFDAIQKLRDAEVVMIGGFHSPMEHECLDLLLRGTQPVILCAAKRLHNLRIGNAARKALAEGRLLILSLFDDRVRRTNSDQAVLRNRLVASLSKAILVPHASQKGKTWTTVREALSWGQRILTFDDEANDALMASGARILKGSGIEIFLM